MRDHGKWRGLEKKIRNGATAFIALRILLSSSTENKQRMGSEAKADLSVYTIHVIYLSGFRGF